MKWHTRMFPLILILLLVCVPEALTQTTHRPVTDFANAQVIALGWGDLDTGYVAIVDYAGITNRWLMARGIPDLGTTYSGDVTETVLSDGRTRVSVVLHTRSAFARARTQPYQTVFGYSMTEVLDGATPVLGDCLITVEFAHAVPPGGPLPDLVGLFAWPTPDQELLAFTFVANVQGPLRAAFGVPEGTPGMMQVAGVNRSVPGRGRPFTDFMNPDSPPTDWVKIHVLGKQ